MGWLDGIFGGLSRPDYDKMYHDRVQKEQKEQDDIFDISKNVEEINKSAKVDAVAFRKSENGDHKKEVKEERKKEKKAKAEDKLVLDTAKIQCVLCANPIGDLKVNFKTPTIQGKKTATVKEKDMTSLMFKGNCSKSPQSASPCAGVMQLGKWKDVGTIKVQDKFPLLLKSTIKCNYGGTDIKILDCAQINVPSNIESTPKEVKKPIDFNIKFELDAHTQSVVPFGIKDFENNIENPFFSFKYTLSKSKIDSLEFQIMDEDDKVIYQMTHLKGIIVEASKKPSILFEAKKPTEGPLISKTWDFDKFFSQYTLSDIADYTDVGEYFIHWDGFDDNEIYDSTRFNGKDLKARITATKGDKKKSITVDFSTSYSQVQWTDVKIDKKAKRIDVTLRVNLKDGGAIGLEPQTFNIEEEISGETFTIDKPDPFKNFKSVTISNSPPKDILKSIGKSALTTRTKSFEQLRDLAIDGLAQYWGRNATTGKNVMLDGVAFEVFVNAINLKDKSKTMDDMPLVYHTNGDSGRSGNTGGSYKDNNLDDNIINLIPDTGVVQQLSYNTGY